MSHSIAKLFKNTEFHEMQDNLVALLDAATSQEIELGSTWYKDAHKHAKTLSVASGRSLSVVCAVIALLSPQKKWAENLLEAETCLSLTEVTREAVKAASGRGFMTSGREYNKVNLTLSSRLVKVSDFGLKTGAFMALIFNPDNNDVVIDIWALRGVFNTPVNAKFNGFGSGAQDSYRYSAISDVFKSVAVARHLKAQQIQAITWLVKRRLAGYEIIGGSA